jgi:hypothetical protein
MLIKDIDIVAVGMEGGNPDLSPFLPVVSVIVVRAEIRDPVTAQDLGDSLRESGLARGTVTHHS